MNPWTRWKPWTRLTLQQGDDEADSVDKVDSIDKVDSVTVNEFEARENEIDLDLIKKSCSHRVMF